MSASSRNHTNDPICSPCSTFTLPEVAVTTHFACEHSTRDVIPIFARNISRLAYPELPFVPGIRERYNYFQTSNDRCALCRLPSHSSLESDHDAVKVHHYICGHQTTTLVANPHATKWPRGPHEEAVRNPAGLTCGACILSYSKIMFECGHQFLLPKLGPKLSRTHDEQRQEADSGWTIIEWTCPRCEARTKRTRSEWGGEAKDRRENAGTEDTSDGRRVNEQVFLESESERKRKGVEGIRKRAEKVIQQADLVRREAEKVRKWYDKRLARSDFGGEHRRTNDKWCTRLWSLKGKKTARAMD
ncbi:hypothetical protein EV356DRAFT_359893 [Viridothelium virens]|uniref:Uncharacterized protein n=1 Tax=Viridothelium virens TaxID=1048519 RepID=A0A6A6HI52_VIRVR|nr:hypothetical protein EV356DRAFT_359893 [Viridothelium virens]